VHQKAGVDLKVVKFQNGPVIVPALSCCSVRVTMDNQPELEYPSAHITLFDQ